MTPPAWFRLVAHAVLVASVALGCSGRIGQPEGQEQNQEPPGDNGDNPAPPTAGAIDGAVAYQQLCSACHGANGEGGGSSPALNAASAFAGRFTSVAQYPDLVRYNESSMPFGRAAECEGTRPGTCAFEVSRFIYETFLNVPVNEDDVLDDDGDLIVPAPSAECAGPVYGPQQVKLLSRQEIQNSLEALLGITETLTDGLPSDFEYAGFSNQKNGVATQAHVQAYFDLALDAAARARVASFAGIADLSASCATGSGDAVACQNELLDGLGRRLFRRPLTADERADFAELLPLAASNVQTALELTIAGLLNAPAFLYRTEIGAPASEVIDSAEDAGGTVTVNGRSFATRSLDYTFDDEQGGVLGFGLASNGYIEHPFAIGTGATITIQARGQAYQGVWPQLEVSVAGQVLDTLTVASDTYGVYEVDAPTAAAGEQPLRLTFINDDSAPNPNDGDRNVMVADVTVESSTTSLSGELSRELADVPQDARVLTGYELASLLSYGLTGYPPDDELLSKAESGALVLADELRAQSARLLASERAQAHMGRFASDWLDADDILSIGKSDSLFPNFDDALRADMLTEIEALFRYVLYNDRPIAELLSADYAVVNASLATYYGLAAPNPADGFVRVQATNERGGLIRTGAFLTVNAGFTDSSLIQRAVSIRSQLLCQEIPPPGDAIVNGGREDSVAQVFADFTQEQIDALTTREYVELQTSPETCAQCHETMINPLGGGLEAYDAVGRFRTTEKGKPVNAVGALIGLTDLFNVTEQAPFANAAELSTVLAQQPGPSRCLTTKALSFLASVSLEGAERCVVDPLASRVFEGAPLRVLFEDLATLPTVRFRR